MLQDGAWQSPAGTGNRLKGAGGKRGWGEHREGEGDSEGMEKRKEMLDVRKYGES